MVVRNRVLECLLRGWEHDFCHPCRRSSKRQRHTPGSPITAHQSVHSDRWRTHHTALRIRRGNIPSRQAKREVKKKKKRRKHPLTSGGTNPQVCVAIVMENHYETLGLGQRQHDGNLTAQDIKQAYRRALLQHHPDKAQVSGALQTVDAITLAYKTLSEPVAKAEYDRELRLKEARGQDNDKVFHTGLDVVDLDDLNYDEATEIWWRSCRCGQERGFIVTEDELEKDARYGELVTGCRGCSLWLKVLFGVEEDEGHQDAPPTG